MDIILHDRRQHLQADTPSPIDTPISPYFARFPLPLRANHQPPASREHQRQQQQQQQRPSALSRDHAGSGLNNDDDEADNDTNDDVYDDAPADHIALPPVMAATRPDAATTAAAAAAVAAAKDDDLSLSNGLLVNTQLSGALLNTRPAPAYVAPFGAAQVLGEHRPSITKAGSDEDDSKSIASSMAGLTSGTSEVQFSPAALALVNSFLDQLLFSFLANAKSTSLTALRPAVSEVLRSKLAAAAIARAEAELHELLAGGEDEEEELDSARQARGERQRTWDLELVWKRTRLRVMVYTRLGEVEDDDEERYVREEELFQGSERRFSQSTGLVSWAAAIFLTTVLEYVAEQTVRVAAQIARTRARRASQAALAPPPLTSSAASISSSSGSSSSPTDGVTVEEIDMDNIALNAKLGRLWRAWRSALRGVQEGAPLTLTSATLKDAASGRTRDSHPGPGIPSPGQTSHNSFGTAHENDEEENHADDDETSTIGEDDHIRDAARGDGDDEIPDAHHHPEHVLAANIPLPLSGADVQRDIDEIEVPGLARDPDEEDLSDGFRTPEEHFIKHRRSASDFNLLASTAAAAAAERPELPRKRSRSVPTTRGLGATAAASASRKEDPTTVADTVAAAAKKVGAIVAAAAGTGTEGANDESKANAEGEEEEKEKEDGAHQTGIVAGAVAGASALAAAAASLVYRSASVSGAKKAEAGAETDAAAPAVPATAAAAVREDVKADTPTSATTTVVGDRAEQTTIGSAKNVVEEDWENQKYLVDLKKMALATPVGTRPPTSAEEPVKPAENTAAATTMTTTTTNSEEPETSPSSRPESRASQQSFSLLPSESATNTANASTAAAAATLPARNSSLVNAPRSLTTEAVNPEEGTADDDAAIVPSTEQQQQDDDEEESLMKYTNTANPKRYSRLILGMDELSPVEAAGGRRPSDALLREVDEEDDEDDNVSAVQRSNSTAGMGSSLTSGERFPRRSVSPVSEQLDPPYQKTRAQQNRLSAPILNGYAAPTAAAQSPPAAEKSKWRQSLGAAVERSSGAWSSASPNAKKDSPPQDANVHDHPVIQKIASLKNSPGGAAAAAAAKAAGANGTGKDDETSPLTSASIKGPEDFEMFVQGGDTVKYTLTPENVRSGASSPTYGKGSREKLSSQSQRDSPDGGDARAGRSQSIKHATAAAMAATGAAADDLQRASENDLRSSTRAEKRQSIGRPPTRNTSASRRSGYLAREPQVQTESTRDFADFIRSTGPDKDRAAAAAAAAAAKEKDNDLAAAASIKEKRKSTSGVYGHQSNRSSISLSSVKQSFMARARSLSRSRGTSPGPRSGSRVPLPADEDAPPVPQLPGSSAGSTGRGRGRTVGQPSTYIPRDAKGANKDGGTSDLIDFIRRGPLSVGRTSSRKERRTIAPFRSTMDSEQMNDWEERATSSRQSSSANSKTVEKRKSWRKSFGGTSARNVAASSNVGEVAHPAYSGQPPSLSSSFPTRNSSLPPAPPPKTTSRVKDPYDLTQFDNDDDFDDDDPRLADGPGSPITALPTSNGNGVRHEESLVEFLRSTGPEDRPGGLNGNSRSISQPGVVHHGADILSARTATAATSGSSHPRASLPRGFPKTYQPKGSDASAATVRPATTTSRRQQQDSSVDDTRELAEFLRTSGPADNGPASKALPPGITRNKSAPQTPQSISSKASKLAPSTAATGSTVTPSEGKRRWWSNIFSSKGRASREAARRNGQPAYLDM